MFSSCSREYDGKQSACKSCKNKYYTDNKEHYTEYAKQYSKDHSKEIIDRVTKWQKENRTRHLAWRNQYSKQPMTAYKEKVRRDTRQLILQGFIQHPGCCEECGTSVEDTTVHVHHLTYMVPNEVLFLCPQCHNDWHRNNPAPPEPTQEWVEAWYESYKNYPEEDYYEHVDQ